MVAIKGMGDDVTRAHELQDLWQGNGRAADVHHQLAAGLVGSGRARRMASGASQ